MKPFVHTIGIILICQLMGNAIYAQGAPSVSEEAFFRLKTRIEACYFSYDEMVIQPILEQALAQIEAYPDAWYPRYYAGLLNIQLGNIARATDRREAYRCYREALTHMRIAHERSPTAETTIVLADAYGKLASLRTFKMLYYGSQSKSYLINAFHMDEGSPKNHLLAGIEIMWTPRFFGGSKERAREFLTTALALEHRWQEKDRLVVNWATLPEIFAHLAQLEILCDTPDQAKQYVAKALEVIPDYGFVLRDVIPQIE